LTPDGSVAGMTP